MSRRSRKVWVVMSNDLPDAVFSTEETAVLYCNTKTKADIADSERNRRSRIYYRPYEFTLNEWSKR